jgi:multiple sugar transport system ATP-binding protein
VTIAVNVAGVFDRAKSLRAPFCKAFGSRRRLHGYDFVMHIRLTHLTKRFVGGPGLIDCSLEIPSGERLVLLGPSGSGKTTLLRLIAGLETPDAGTVAFDSVDVTSRPPHRRGIAYVAQRAALYPEMTVREHMTASHPATDVAGSPIDIIALLRLGELLSKRPHELSGGETQRVALARAVQSDAKLWLLDEPFTALDPPFRAEFRAILHLLHERSRATIIVVSHDAVDAWALGRRVGVLGDGRLRCLATPGDLHDRPGDRFVAMSLGLVSLVDGVVSDGRPGLSGRGESAGASFASADGSVRGPLPAFRQPRPPDTHLTLGIRPDGVRRVTPGNPDDGIVLQGWTAIAAEPVGSGWILTLARGPTGRVRAAWPSETPCPIGHVADWTCPPDRCLWFDAAGDRIDV